MQKYYVKKIFFIKGYSIEYPFYGNPWNFTAATKVMIIFLALDPELLEF